MPRSRISRLGMVAAVIASLAIGASTGVAAAVASPTVTTAPPGGPGPTNLSGTTFNLSDVGYQASEFFVAGSAKSYHDVATHAASTVTNVALTTNVATITTSADHGISVGDVVTITGLSNTVLNVTQRPVTAVPSSTTFTFALTTANIASVADSGTVTPNLTANGLWSVAPDATEQPFKTRVQVYAPTNPAAFNGTVYVEWLNVTNGFDSAADWILAHNEIIRSGAIWIGATTQAAGVNGAVSSDPARYGAAGANLLHPGDSFSYDIYSQVGQAIRDNQATILGGHTLGKLISIGESQSANRLASYIDALGVQDHVYDGYFVHSRIGSTAALRGAPLVPVSAPTNPLIRTDLGVPVFTLQTETDNRNIRQPDSNVFRDWEIAGTAHASIYTLGIGEPDTGTTAAAVAYFQSMLHPTNDPIPGIIPPCGLPVNAGPDHWFVQSGLHALRDWVTNGTPPAPSLYQQTSNGLGSGTVTLDPNLNVVGGVRSPHVDVPVATIRGVGQTGATAGFCSLFGTTVPFSSDTLNSLYSSHDDFVAKWNASVDHQVSLGYLLAADAPLIKFPAAASTVGLRLPGAPTVTGVAPSGGALSVSFTPPGGPDADKITGYTATCTDGVSTVQSAAGATSPISVGGLVNGNTYTCTVRTTNPIGDSVESGPSSPTKVGQPQTITFGALADRKYGSAPFGISATATSALPVVFTSATTGVCTVSATTVTLVGLGTCTIQADQPGNTTWLPAPAVQQSFRSLATVKSLLPGNLPVKRGVPILVVFALVDAKNKPIPDAIARTANIQVAFNAGPPVKATYVALLDTFTALVPTSKTLPAGSYPLTVTSASTAVPFTPTTTQVRIIK